MNKTLTEKQVKLICDILANKSNGLTRVEIKEHLTRCRIALVSDRCSNNGHVYTIGLNKRDWLYNCFVNEIANSGSFNKVFLFIVRALAPMSYTAKYKRNKYRYLFEEINKVLLHIGLEIQRDGVLMEAINNRFLDGVDGMQ